MSKVFVLLPQTMGIPSELIIILLGAIIILSYVFNIISKWTSIPSVLLLIATGVAAQYLLRYYGKETYNVEKLVRITGAVGLLMIILEAALDLNIGKEKVKMIGSTFGAAFFVLLVSSFGIAWLLSQWMDVPFGQSMLYAVPMSIVSSAIVIPSTEELPEAKKEFVIYESSFSDILGILAFDYMLMPDLLSALAAFSFVGRILLALVISAVASIVLIFILTRIQIKLKFFLLFAVLAIIYASGELIHLPSLLVILTFGLLLNNARSIFRGKTLSKILPEANIKPVVELLHTITAETSFVIRTFFFILFGYTIQLSVFAELAVWQLGGLVVGVLLLVRFLYLKLILKSDIFPELLLMPRGLITILLFYSIPNAKKLPGFNEGVMFFVVVATTVLMMLGLLFTPREDRNLIEGRSGLF